MTKHTHYFKDVSHLEFIDVYRVLDLWGVTSPGLQHAIKKLLNAGGRGAKDYTQDLREAIDSIQRALEMEGENGGLDGWIPWHGGRMPVDKDVNIKIRTRDPGSMWNDSTGLAVNFYWSHHDRSWDIIAYKILG